MGFFKKWSDRNRRKEPEQVSVSEPREAQPEPPPEAPRQCTYQVGEAVQGRFEVVGVREGGMGIVYLCMDRKENVPVALKTFKPEYLPDRTARDRFLREATVWVNLGQHPHIVTCHQVLVGSGGAEAFLVLDLVATAEGKRDATLRAWLSAKKPLSHEQALQFVLHIARGMRHATTVIPGLVHRDLKPENVLVGPDRIARITDFGLANAASQPGKRPEQSRMSTASLERTQLTQGGIVGTPLYMAPEQWSEGVVLDARTDIYAVGCILYEMVSGQFAVRGQNLEELEQAHRKGRIESLPRSVAPQLVALVHRCLSTDRGERYASWEQVETAVMETYRSLVGRDAPAQVGLEEYAQATRVQWGWSHYAIGHAYLGISKYDASSVHFEQAREAGAAEHDSILEGAALASLGHVSVLRGDASQGIDQSRRALTFAREQSLIEVEGLALSSLAAAYRDVGDARQAVESYEQALAITGVLGNRAGQASILNSLGNLYRRLGQIQHAQGLYEQSLALMEEVGDRPGVALVLNHLGICYRKSGDVKRAIATFEQALSLSQQIGDRANVGRVLDNLANAYSDVGEHRRSLELSEQALVIDREVGARRGEGTALGNIARSHSALRQFDKAAAIYRQALLVVEEIGDLEGIGRMSLGLGAALADLGEDVEGLQHARRAVEAFEQFGNPELALNARQVVAKLQARVDTGSHMDAGVMLAKQGRLEEAISEYMTALRLSPDSAVLHFNLAAAYSQVGRTDEAIAELETSIRLWPSLPEAHLLLGEAHWRRNRVDDAIRELEAALRLSRQDVAAQRYDGEAHRYLGICYDLRGRRTEAIAEHLEAIRLDPNDSWAHHCLAFIYSQQGRVDEAIREYEASIRINPANPDAHFSLGVKYEAKGRLDDAIREYQAVVRLNPQDADAHTVLGNAYLGLGRRDEAIRELSVGANLGSQDARNLLRKLGLG